MNRKMILLPLILATCLMVLGASGKKQAKQPLESGHTGATPQTAAATAPDYFVKRLTVQHGAPSRVYSGDYGTGVSVGQNATGRVSGTNYNVSLGFWYGKTVCPVALTGDVNESGSISPPDVIYLVNVVFKVWPDPLPCRAAGDVNCSGNVSPPDIVALVNYVFKAGAAPCNVCTIIPSQWACP